MRPVVFHNSLETVKNGGKYWLQPGTDDVFRQSGVRFDW